MEDRRKTGVGSATISRRAVLTMAGMAAAGAALGPAWPALASGEAGVLRFGPSRPFSFEELIKRAEGMARSEYTPPRGPAGDLLDQVSYEHLGRMRFRPESALYADGPSVYPATFFHLGRFARVPVRIYAVADGAAREVVYSPDYFEVPADSPARELPDDAGFAGFRFQEARSRSDWRTQDWVAFQGASYFRAIGALGQYGISARGIAVNTTAPGPEEFPVFTEFYITPTETEGEPAVVFALLNGPSMTGAYRFALEREEGVIMDIEMRLFMREEVSQLGIAPLTSMFWYGEYGAERLKDWRPEVHDSDGLAMWTGNGERIWRPLKNPPETASSAFVDQNPKGFGLLQRDREFSHYLDGVRYERRPSLWVEPVGAWGKGAIELVEIPTDDEIHDNIVAFWRPEERAPAGSSYSFRYKLHWLADEPYRSGEVAHTVSTRLGRGGEPGTPRPKGVRKFVVEFEGGPLAELDANGEPEPVITASRGEVSNTSVEPVPGTTRWRAKFDLAANGHEPVDLRMFLRHEGRALTETWLYQHHPGEALAG